MKTVLITGITGQDGAYLSKFLLEKDYNVVGITRNLQSGNLNGLSFLGVENDVRLVEANVFDLSNIIRLLEKYKPDEFYNLAAQSSVGLSFDQPIGTLEYNIISVANILEAIRIVNKDIKVYQSSSSEMYGNVNKNLLPIDENFNIHPASPYAISKAAAHWVCVNYREAYKLFISSGILFNHESVLRRQNFVTKKIISSAIKIKKNKLDFLKVGNTSIMRDWGYAPEYIKVMWKMLNVPKPSDYIICTGEAHTLQEFIDKVFIKLGLDPTKYVKFDKALYRPVELEVIYGNPQKAKAELEWNYSMTFDDLINKLIEDEIKYNEWWISKSKI
ncbi:MAG: GDP-mannose 4,6-dehydratase [Ignavibacteriaceae bacterium]|nr:GDP-mannose 4,6-dehydratase [Ignavibacteriaceae bacterium]HMN24870.1 GDP-mannose 4,6-dehydratase [Ignavibacteriaceae bacterium]HRN27841.1 GDP-mannose 4,6-dehydratase [Ignavibacteriaceae bacterium]HRP94423.1 GDP-mannose 4,6-dehydratase [Ignavibacteriaceae bacterium]HRQ55521.1 GDP-mannose 4,6-dehydratase [Ignavibacteriaceae bacterium]